MKKAAALIAVVLISTACLSWAQSRVKFDTLLVRIGTPIVLRAKGVTTGNWILRNVDGGAWQMNVRQMNAGVVVVSLTITKAFKKYPGVDPDMVLSPMLSWEDPAGKVVNIPMTVVAAGARAPAGAGDYEMKEVQGVRSYIISTSTGGDWGDKVKPLIYIPLK